VAVGCELAEQEAIMKQVASRSAELLRVGFLLDLFFTLNIKAACSFETPMTAHATTGTTIRVIVFSVRPVPRNYKQGKSRI
jgi:hypothetical protein